MEACIKRHMPSMGSITFNKGIYGDRKVCIGITRGIIEGPSFCLSL